MTRSRPPAHETGSTDPRGSDGLIGLEGSGANAPPAGTSATGIDTSGIGIGEIGIEDSLVPLDDQPAGRGLGRSASTAFFLHGGGAGLQYLSQILLARALGPNAFGTYTYALTWSRIAGSVCHVGGATGSLRLVPQYRAGGQWSKVAGVLRRSRQIPLALGSVVAALGAAGLLAWDQPGSDASVVALALVIVPIAALIEVQVSLTRAFEEVFRAFFPWLVLQPFVLVAAIVGARALGADLGAEDAVLLTLVSYLATVLVQARWLRDATPSPVRSSERTFSRREWRDVTLPTFGANVVYLVFSRLDIVMVGVLRSTREAGIYAVAMRVGSLASILQTAMNAMVAPRIARLYWSGRKEQVEGVVLSAVGWVFLPTLVLTALLSVLAGPVLRVFGGAFDEGSGVLVLIALGQLVSVSSGPVGWLMNLTGHQKTQALVLTATAAVTLASYVVLVPWLGMVGAALANAGAVVARNLLLNQLTRRRLGVRVSVVRALRQIRSGTPSVGNSAS